MHDLISHFLTMPFSTLLLLFRRGAIELTESLQYECEYGDEVPATIPV